MNDMEKAGFTKTYEGSDYVAYDRVMFYENCASCGKAYPDDKPKCPYCEEKDEH